MKTQDEITRKVATTIANQAIEKVEKKWEKAKQRLTRYLNEGYLIDRGNYYEVNYIPSSTYRSKIHKNLIDGVLPKDIAIDVLY